MDYHMSNTRGDGDKAGKVVERRKEIRYRVKDGIFTVPNPRIQSSRLGNIIDISMGGLAFQYFLVRNMSFKEFTKLDIYISGDGMFMADLPVQIVSDVELVRSEKQLLTTCKRFGVQFKTLDSEKQEKLHRFIENHTMHAV